MLGVDENKTVNGLPVNEDDESRKRRVSNDKRNSEANRMSEKETTEMEMSDETESSITAKKRGRRRRESNCWRITRKETVSQSPLTGKVDVTFKVGVQLTLLRWQHSSKKNFET